MLLSMNLLAFLLHTVLDLVDQQYQAIRAALGTRRTFFQDFHYRTVSGSRANELGIG